MGTRMVLAKDYDGLRYPISRSKSPFRGFKRLLQGVLNTSPWSRRIRLVNCLLVIVASKACLKEVAVSRDESLNRNPCQVQVERNTTDETDHGRDKRWGAMDGRQIQRFY